jgi:hypothetical protein
VVETGRVVGLAAAVGLLSGSGAADAGALAFAVAALAALRRGTSPGPAAALASR